MTDRLGHLFAAVIGALVVTASVLTAPPAHASVGGAADALGFRAHTPEVTVDVTATGAVAMVQPILDRLTARPILDGSQEIGAQVGTPDPTSGHLTQSVSARSIPGVVHIAEVTASTQRVENGELSATAHVGGLGATILGLDVLQVGEVNATAITHPDESPRAEANEPAVEVFGRQVPVPADDPIDIDESLKTADALAALEQAFPGIERLITAVGGVVEAGGRVQVRLGRTENADPDSGSAQAVGFYADVGLRLNARICIPNIGGQGCLAEITLGTDAQVLDLVLAQTSVERPDRVPLAEGIDWVVVIPIIAAVALALFALGLLLGRLRRRQLAAAEADEPGDTATARPPP